MQLRHIRLQGFRNYRELELDAPASLNIFVGRNAQGKTNLLEAIYLLALGRSYRTLKDDELIGWDAPFAKVSAEVAREMGSVRIEILLPKEGVKEVRVGGERLRRLSDLLGNVHAVVFSPDDLQLLKGAPSLRRRFLDAEIAQLSSLYRHHFLRYQRVLKQRNNLLKAIRGGYAAQDALEMWDEQLVNDGAHIVAKRAETVRRLARFAYEVYEGLTGGRERLTVAYRPFFAAAGEAPHAAWEERDAVKSRFEEALTRMRKEEVLRGSTLVGPHRDDINFLIEGKEARSFGSQGQQRSAVLAAKLAELEFFREEAGEYPLLLLDDVMSELDDARRTQFLSHVSGRVNTFVTTTNLRSFPREVLENASIYEISAGTVTRRSHPAESIGLENHPV